jgi:hypothetical protein
VRSIAGMHAAVSAQKAAVVDLLVGYVTKVNV